MFALKEFPWTVLAIFANPDKDTDELLRAAIDSGETDVNDLTDLVFFKAHPERVDGLEVDFISQRERHTKALSEEWVTLQKSVVIPALATGPRPTTVSTWQITPRLAADAKKMGGRKLLAWLREPPTAAFESAEFRPARAQRDEFVSILAWKSHDPKSQCVFSNARVQMIYLARDDEAFWMARTTSERHAVIRQAAAAAANRAYRAHVIDDGLCPESARVRELSIQESLILQMASGAVQMIPTPGVKGKFAAPGDAKSLGEILSALSSLLGD